MARPQLLDSLPDGSSNSVPILLLPPSEGKANDTIDGDFRDDLGDPWAPVSGAFKVLGDSRQHVVEALAAVDGGDQKLLGVKGDRLDRARRANSELVGAPTLPAWKRYTGVVWDHLDPASLAAADRRRIVVVSGLSGLVRGDDPVPDYRLKMGANLAPLGKLSTWWRTDVTDQLAKLARGRTAKQQRVLVDLLPNEHRAAWAPADDERVVGVDLVDPSGKPGGHFAKAAKGELARALLTEGWAALDGWEPRLSAGPSPSFGTIGAWHWALVLKAGGRGSGQMVRRAGTGRTPVSLRRPAHGPHDPPAARGAPHRSRR